jgi:hypothetical protein
MEWALEYSKTGTRVLRLLAGQLIGQAMLPTFLYSFPTLIGLALVLQVILILCLGLIVRQGVLDLRSSSAVSHSLSR